MLGRILRVSVNNRMLRSCVGRVRFMAGEAGSSGGFVKTEQGLNDLYMRAVEPKPLD